MSLSSRQKRRISRTREAARQLREVREMHAERRNLLPVAARRHPDYWRDLSVEIVGTIISAAMLFGFGRAFGYIERPSGRSELLHALGVLAIVFVVGFVAMRVRRVRADHPGASGARLTTAYLRAIEPHWSLPTIAIGVALMLGYF